MGFIPMRGTYPQNFKTKRKSNRQYFVHNDYTNTDDQPDIIDYFKQFGYPNQYNGWGYGAITAWKDAMIAWGASHNVPQDLINKFVTIVQNNPQSPSNKTFWQKAKDTFHSASVSIQNAAQQVGSGVKNIPNQVNALQNKLSNLTTGATFDLALPYKPLMVAALKAKGHKVSMSDSIKNVTLLFYRAVIQNKQTFDREHLDPTDTSSLLVNPIDGSKNPISPNQVKTILLSIVNYIKNVVSKKQSGNALDPVEKIVSDQNEVVNTNQSVTKPNMNILQKIELFIGGLLGQKQNYQKQHLRRRIEDRSKSKNTALSGTIVTGIGVEIPRPMNDTETAYALRSANFGYQYLAKKGTIASAMDIPTNLRKPNSWWQDGGGGWHWIDNAGHIST